MLPCRLWLLIISVFLVVARLPEAENASPGRFQPRQKRQTTGVMSQYCGRKLSSTLQTLCDGTYNSRFNISNQDGEVNDYSGIYEYHPFKSAENAKKMLRYRRNDRGIYEECCLKPCYTSELQYYCGGG